MKTINKPQDKQGNISRLSKKTHQYLSSVSAGILMTTLTCCEGGDISHNIQPKESIYKILLSHNISPTPENIKQVCINNNIDTKKYIIHPGNKLHIPHSLLQNKQATKKAIKKHQSSKETLTTFDYHERYKNIEIVDERLKGKVFVIDPGHGGVDPGAQGIVHYKHNGTTCTAWESEITYDIGLRNVKELRSHGADVYITRYNTTRGIVDQNLPIDNHYANKGGKGIRQYDVDGINPDDNLNHNDTPVKYFGGKENELSQQHRLTKKVNIAKHAATKHPTSPIIFISHHLDAGASFSIRYQANKNNTKTDNKSKKFAHNLVKHGFVWTYIDKKNDINFSKKPDIIPQNLHVLRENNVSQHKILIEWCDITKSESWKARGAENRQKGVESLVTAIIKTLGQ